VQCPKRTLHVSLASALDAKPIGGEHGPTILTLMRDHIAGRIPLIAAGHIRTPEQAEQAEQAIAAGLSPVANRPRAGDEFGLGCICAR
jgi:2,4-dienoyl-CoA reductase-like NADH-dependent reductase (Old Yellow Enzyme family)